MKYDTQYTPTMRGASIGNGTLRGEFSQQGRRTYWRMWFELGTTSTIDGPLEFTLPTLADGDMEWPWPMARCNLTDASTSMYYPGHVEWNTTHITVGVLDTSTARTFAHRISATFPFVWSAGDSIRIDGVHLSSLGLGE